jgi:glutamine synthetase
LNSRFNILSEAYVKTVSIEALTALVIAKTFILPAVLRYQKEAADSVASAKAAGANSTAGTEILSTIVSGFSDLSRTIAGLEKAANHHGDADPYAHAKHIREQVIPAMAELRKVADKLEGIIPDDIWPLPTYREMLFIK